MLSPELKSALTDLVRCPTIIDSDFVDMSDVGEMFKRFLHILISESDPFTRSKLLRYVIGAEELIWSTVIDEKAHDLELPTLNAPSPSTLRFIHFARGPSAVSSSALITLKLT